SVLAFGRSGASFLRTGAIRDALLVACARSVGGVLTAADLDEVRPTVTDPRAVDLGARTWSVAPWTSMPDDENIERAVSGADAVDVVAVVDARGAFAIAAIAVASSSLPLAGVDLAAPLLAEPVRRGVPRIAPATPLPMHAPIGLARRSHRDADAFAGIDLALAVGGAGDP